MQESNKSLRAGLLNRHRWLVFVLPFLVFMLLGTFQPSPPQPKPAPGDEPVPAVHHEAEEDGWFGLKPEHYPVYYTVRIVLTVITIVLVLPGYREFPLRISPLSVIVGVVGIVLWLGLSAPNLEEKYLTPLGLASLFGLGSRAAFNPFDALGENSLYLAGFLAIRFFGLVLVVPVIEEFFLRGFVMRFVVRPDWESVPFGTTTVMVVVVGAVYGLLSHPEMLAAAVWFTLITLLMAKTRNIWDCVVAHAVTNLLLGLYVIFWGKWELW